MLSRELPTSPEEFRDWLAKAHFRYKLSPALAPGHGVPVSGPVQITCDFCPGTVFDFGKRHFVSFLQTCLNVPVNESARFSFHFGLDPALPATGFTMTLSPAGAQIRAASENGLVDAMHYLERELVDNGGVLPQGELKRHPALAVRFTEGIFETGHHGSADYPDGILGLMQHYGSNALRGQVSLGEIWQSSILPELNFPGAPAILSSIQATAARLASAGMAYYVILNAKTLPENHAVFQTHPALRGAREEIFLEETSGRGNHVLCTSHPLVLQAYGEVVTNLFRLAPALAGAIILVGGEGFHHCFMRPQGDGLTNCGRCRQEDPHQHVARLVNTLTAAIQAAKPTARLLAWPYGALTWSREDRTESRWIDFLEGGAEVLSNFDCGDSFATQESGAALFDYNIMVAGPSSRFLAQAAKCRERGIPILAKTETNTTPDTFFVPHLPVPFRWFERFRAIREQGCAGYMGQWFFYGMNGSIPEELQYHSVWNPERNAAEVLTTIARRDFHLDQNAADEVVAAWRDFSAAWDSFPYSAMTCGEREAYMRGPWFLGPSHPLVFNEQNTYDLSRKFFTRRGDLSESLSEEEIARLPGKPRYVCNLLFCLPFGVEEYLRLAKKCRDDWDRAVARLIAACGQNPTIEARRELNVCHILSCHLHTLVNTVEFFHLRDDMARKPCSAGDFETQTAGLQAILTREIENARRALPIVQADARIGFGHNYGQVYDAEMIQSKIRQCEFVRDRELPRIGSVVRFHVWYRYP